MTTFNLRNAVVEMGDSGYAHFISITIGDGNITYSEKVNREYLMNRGNIDEVIDGDQVPMDVSFDFRWQFITGTGSVVTVEDALKKRGNAAAWVTTGASCEPYCVDIKIIFTPICITDSIEIIILPEYRYEELSHDAKGRSVSSKGRCNATQASVSRVSQ